MRLKSMKLAGFKSFVDPTVVDFPSNMSAVVGPNGCGKSNIIDACRWVMGESSAKNLRGENMTDVIFNGSTGRKPVSRASIELIFDNHEHRIQGEYAHFNEISVKRVVTREGDSNYFLNGGRCRRKDITDLFLGTGLGPRSYSIIEQGMISKIIEAKPEELRVYIEEAAGISKYKERRRDTENRIRRTRENLARLSDLRTELGRNLETLERQARAAERWKAFKEEERTLDAQRLAIVWRDLDRQTTALGSVVLELEVEQEALVTERVSAESGQEETRVERDATSEQFNRVQADFYKLSSEIEKLEQRIEHQRQREQGLYDEQERLGRELRAREAEQANDQAEIDILRVQIDEHEMAREEATVEEEAAQSLLSEREDAQQQWQGRWQAVSDASADIRRTVQVEQSRIEQMESMTRRMDQRAQRLEQERHGLLDEAGCDRLDALEADFQVLEAQLVADQTDLQATEGQITGLRTALDEVRTALDGAQGLLHEAAGKRASLETLQQASAGQGKAAAAWLEKQGLSDGARLFEQMQVQPRWRTAVETVLGEQLHAPVVETLEAYAEALDRDLDRGGLSLMAPDARNTDETGCLAGCIEAGPVPDVLASILCAPDLAMALAMRSRLEPGQSVITPSGLWLGTDWVRVRRPESGEDGLIARQANLSALKIEIGQLEGRVAELSAQRSTMTEALAGAEQQRQSLQQGINRQQKDRTRLEAELARKRARMEQVQKRTGQIDRELEELRQQADEERHAIAEARVMLEDALERMARHEAQRNGLESERQQLADGVMQARQQVMQAREAVHQHSMALQTARTRLDALEQAVARLARQMATQQARLQEVAQLIADCKAPDSDEEAELELMLGQKLHAEKRLKEAREALESVEQRLRSLEQQWRQADIRLQTVRTDLERHRLELAELNTRKEGAGAQLEEHEQALEPLLADLPEQAQLEDWELNLKRVRERIQRLGNINLAAIEEYEQQSLRKNFLDIQDADLNKALDTLENAIQRIDRETRVRFRETFDRVNAGLQALFPRVFGGGTAGLVLTGEDLLDAGVALMARPPGKKNSTIHLLSGGEKALTAIALVFSIFQLNPAPFCMLDEVDAPLDDANVARYARLVKEMSGRVQFVYITHNKVAMEMADHLMGVTMHEPGVSRMVAVDVEEAARLAEA